MEQQKSSTIFINPKFKNAYINPNFLKNSASATQIHLNPKFLQQQQQQQDAAPPPLQQHKKPEATSVNSSAIIKNTKRSLIRAPMKIESKQEQQPAAAAPSHASPQNLIKISNTKLIKASHLMKYQQKENENIKNATESLIKSKKLKNSESIYKLDRRKPKSPKKM
jgi:hypothetical protein